MGEGSDHPSCPIDQATPHLQVLGQHHLAADLKHQPPPHRCVGVQHSLLLQIVEVNAVDVVHIIAVGAQPGRLDAIPLHTVVDSLLQLLRRRLAAPAQWMGGNDFNELRVILPLHISQFQGAGDTALPGRCLETEHPLLAPLGDWWQLQEVATQDELNTSKGLVILPH
ncbi:hypothetical protein E2C01_032746 [Portunus trituberculatus]|uniref:Uncharacterized protein n=1 Tax=Portunus trituberculatus TaxID=210409 RepID=A0A5B7EW23_PORTR|nr:hypothetical protein [Portunus trituberculatus]